MKRWLAVALCVVLAMAMLPVWSAAADTLTVAELREKYPHGAYWNHTKGGSEDYTWNPCTHHTGNCTYNGSCGCNTYKNVAIQCMGFAYQLAELAYGGNPRGEWPTDYNSSALNTLKAGDIVRYSNNGHSIFILGVEGDTVTFVDANGDGRCQIYWDRTTTKAKLKSTFTYVKSAPYALPAEPASGMTLTAAKASVTMGQTVTVTLRYEGGGKTIGALMGTLKYDTAAFAFDSHVGTDVEVNDVDGSIRYVYCASQAQAPEAVEMAFTFTAVGGGKSTFVATTEEFVSDGDYVSLGTPTEQVAVTVVVPTLTVSYHGNGGTIDNTVVGYTYRVLSDNGINMRADAGTDKTKLTALPYNTVFTVAAGDTKTANGYTWGKTTYNGKTGWVVISDFVEKTADLPGGEWLLTKGLVTRSDGTSLTHTFDYGSSMTALCDPEDVGLYRTGHRFMGWNTAADGSGITFKAGMTPSDLCADGAKTVTLYATWLMPIRGDANGDGAVNNRDQALLQQYINKWDVTVSPEADMNGDGAVNNRDLALLQQYINKWEV